jgi:hypothetical protein
MGTMKTKTDGWGQMGCRHVSSDKTRHQSNIKTGNDRQAGRTQISACLHKFVMQQQYEIRDDKHTAMQSSKNVSQEVITIYKTL